MPRATSPDVFLSLAEWRALARGILPPMAEAVRTPFGKVIQDAGIDPGEAWLLGTLTEEETFRFNAGILSDEDVIAILAKRSVHLTGVGS